MSILDKEIPQRWHKVWERIRPYRKEEVKKAIEELQSDPAFNAILQKFPQEVKTLLQAKSCKVESVDQFRQELVAPLVHLLLDKSTFSYDLSGTSSLRRFDAATLLSNHRDILLDAAILNLCLLEVGMPLVRMAVGDNLLYMPWVTILMRLSDAVLVERNLPPKAFVESSKGFSAFLEWSVQEEKKSIWIAQREGRAKDNNDKTQPSLLKMLTLQGGDGSLESRLLNMNIVPMTISYEYDPCDYLKAKEVLERTKKGSYTKAPGEDVYSMKQGLLGEKGRVHINLGTPLVDLIAAAKDKGILAEEATRRPNDYLADIASIIDHEIHSRYRLYPGNYIAEDNLSHTAPLYRGHYSDDDVKAFSDYIEERLALASPSSVEDANELRKLLLLQYATPLRNYYKTRRKSKKTREV